MITAATLDPKSTLEALSGATVQFTLFLALAFVVERLLEILKTLYDWLDAKGDWYHAWTRRTERLRDQLERDMRVFEYVSPEIAANVLRRFQDVVLNEQGGYSGTLPVLSGDLLRAVWIRIAAKSVGIVIGIGLACWAGLDLITMWQWTGTEKLIGYTSSFWGCALSGVAIGLGSGPVHKIITTLERKREERRPAEARRG